MYVFYGQYDLSKDRLRVWNASSANGFLVARSKIPDRVIGYVGYKQIDGETLDIKKLAVSKDSRYYARMRGILEKAKILCSDALKTDSRC